MPGESLAGASPKLSVPRTTGELKGDGDKLDGPVIVEGLEYVGVEGLEYEVSMFKKDLYVGVWPFSLALSQYLKRSSRDSWKVASIAPPMAFGSSGPLSELDEEEEEEEEDWYRKRGRDRERDLDLDLDLDHDLELDLDLDRD